MNDRDQAQHLNLPGITCMSDEQESKAWLLKNPEWGDS